jgi:hypothetical protein
MYGAGSWAPKADEVFGRFYMAMALVAGFYLTLGLAFPHGLGLGAKLGGLLALGLGWLGWPTLATGVLAARCLAALALLTRQAARSDRGRTYGPRPLAVPRSAVRGRGPVGETRRRGNGRPWIVSRSRNPDGKQAIARGLDMAAPAERSWSPPVIPGGDVTEDQVAAVHAEVRTRRLVVVDDQGDEQVVGEVVNGQAELRVQLRSPVGRSTTVLFYAAPDGGTTPLAPASAFSFGQKGGRVEVNLWADGDRWFSDIHEGDSDG